MYALGEGIDKDPRRTFYWLTLASIQEPKLAKTFLPDVKKELESDQIAEVAALAREFRPGSAGIEGQ